MWYGITDMRSFLLLVLLSGVPVQQPSTKQATNPYQYAQPVKQQQNASSAPSLPTVVDQSGAESQQNQTGSKGQKNSSLWKRLLDALIANWPLLIVGIWGVWAALRTLKAIERQADAMVISERAWVIAELVPKRFENMDEDLIYHLRVTNMGRTPAFVTKYAISSSRSDKRGIVGVGLLAFDFPHRSLRAGGQLTFDDRPINLTTLIKEGHVALVLFGSVTYQHVFDHTKFVEEPFCYAFDAETTTLRRAPTPKPNEQKENRN